MLRIHRFILSMAPATLSLLAAVGCGHADPVEEVPCPPGAGHVAAPAFDPPDLEDLTQYVDPMIGSDGSGNVIPGALVPHGMVRVSPVTRGDSKRIGAYHYSDPRMTGFTHTHLEGPGGSYNGYSEILLMPGVGDVQPIHHASAYDHEREQAEPGYYQVRLLDTDINVELTASAHAGIHRYTFPPGSRAWVVVDPTASEGAATDARIEIVGDHEVRGVGHLEVHPLLALLLGDGETSQTDVYFDAEFDHAFAWFGTADGEETHDAQRVQDGKQAEAYVGFDTAAGAVVEARVGISFISTDQARRNLVEEVGGISFDDARNHARDAWNRKLNRIQIEADPEVLVPFYTSLYRGMFQPADYTEAGGWFSVGTSGAPEVENGCGRRFYTDDWCMWDTYRTLHPLGTLIEPEIRGDIIESMLTMYEHGGWLPKCSWHGRGYSRVMTGNPQLAVIADAWMKGLDDFDEDLAWRAMRKTADEEVDEVQDGLCGYFGLGTPPEYIQEGYVGHECDTSQAASLTLELSYADDCMAQVASRLGLDSERERFERRAQSFRNQWNPAYGFMQSRHRDGSWVEPFDPTDDSTSNGFVEATSWIFSFFVPHDVHALIDMMGGQGPFVDRLDTFFSEGHYDASNQPSFHIPWLYNYAGSPFRTQEVVRQLAFDNFDASPAGLPGNDDAGAMSAWYTLAALGLYPVSPGQPIYQLSTPLVRRATLYLNPSYNEGTSFVIETEGAASDVYIQSATLNGVVLDRPYIRHEEVSAGGTLHYVLGPNPSTWGASNPSP